MVLMSLEQAEATVLELVESFKSDGEAVSKNGKGQYVVGTEEDSLIFSPMPYEGQYIVVCVDTEGRVSACTEISPATGNRIH